jgi:hypothetical protein
MGGSNAQWSGQGAFLAFPYKSSTPVRFAHKRIIVSCILNLVRAFNE